MPASDAPSSDGLPAQRRQPPLDLRERGLQPPPGLGLWRRLWWWFDFLILVKLARLRFIAVLVALGGVIAYWDVLQAYYDKWTRPIFGVETAASSDTEFWCPMHPTVVRKKSDKCPICGMPLSKRKKGEGGEEEPLPPGTVSRVQITPYRVALAGIRTEPIGYRRLAREITTVGFVEFDERRLARITARTTGKSRIDKLHVNVTGQQVRAGDPLAELYSPDLVVTIQNLLDARRGRNQDLERMARDRLRLWGIAGDQTDEILRTGRPITHVTIRAPIGGHIIRKYQVEGEYVEEGTRLYDVADLSTVWVEAQVYEDELSFLREGLPVTATTQAFPNRQFRGKAAFVHPHLDAATRTLRVRFDVDNAGHELRPGMYATVRLEVPATELDLLARATTEDWRDRTLADLVGRALCTPTGPPAGAGLDPLLHAATDYATAQQGLVLAVPERAVIDTGRRKLVYREAEPGVYEGVEVELGPRTGGHYPVIRGLAPGDRVAAAGSFLIDAETRLTAGAGSTYFGASGGPQSERGGVTTARPSIPEDEEGKVRAVLARLSAADRQTAAAQRYCPVLLDSRLGSMGTPVKVVLQGQPVFLCCKGCLAKARADERATLNRVAELKARPEGSPPPRSQEPHPPAGGHSHGRADPEVREALAKLSPEDRGLAEAQGFCAVQAENPLGSMGVPVKVMAKGRPVFLCCEGCRTQALRDPDRTLATVERLKGKAKAAPHRGGHSHD